MEYEKKDTLQIIQNYIRMPKDPEAAAVFESVTIPEISQIWDQLSDEEALSIFLALDVSDKADIITMLSTKDQELLIHSLPLSNMKELFALMEPDDLVDIIQTIAPEVRSAVWNSLSDSAKQETLFLLRFDETDAGGIMTPNYLAIRKDLSVIQTINFVRQTAPRVQDISYVYVLDNLNRLKGTISLRQLLSAEDQALVSTIMETDIVSVQEDTDQEFVASLLVAHDFLALPVVDKYNRLLGIVNINDAVDVIRHEHTEDVYKMGGMEGSTDRYLNTSIQRLVRKRVPWLLLLLAAGAITTNMIHLFDRFKITGAFLFWFIPVIMQTAGNTSVQSSTLMIRGISRAELGFRNIWSILGREFFVALILGIILGAFIIVRSIYIVPSVLPENAIILGLALALTVIFACIIGVLAPLVIHRLGFDPTVMTGPLMATFTDVSSLAIYFLIATWLMQTQ